MKVSLIIPCYNCEKTIEETYNSVINQNYKNFEIILVDNNSTDNSYNVITALIKGCDKSILLKQPKPGQAAARNSGAAHAKGEYLLFLDSDDLIDPEFLVKTVNILDTKPEIKIVTTKGVLFGASTKPWVLPPFSLKNLLSWNCIGISSLIRKKDFDMVIGFDESFEYFEDMDLWISILKTGGQVYLVPENLFYYRKRESKDSLTDTVMNNADRVSDLRLKLYIKHYDFYKQHGFYIQNLFKYESMKKKYYSIWYKKLFYKIKGKGHNKN